MQILFTSQNFTQTFCKLITMLDMYLQPPFLIFSIHQFHLISLKTDHGWRLNAISSCVHLSRILGFALISTFFSTSTSSISYFLLASSSFAIKCYFIRQYFRSTHSLAGFHFGNCSLKPSTLWIGWLHLLKIYIFEIPKSKIGELSCFKLS